MRLSCRVSRRACPGFTSVCCPCKARLGSTEARLQHCKVLFFSARRIVIITVVTNRLGNSERFILVRCASMLWSHHCVSPVTVIIHNHKQVDVVSRTLGRWDKQIFRKWSESHSVVSNSLQPHGLYTVHGILQDRMLEWVTFPISKSQNSH